MLLGGVVALAVVVVVEIQITRSKNYLPDPGYDIDARIPGRAPAIELAVAGDSTVAGIGADTIDDTLPMQIASRLARESGREVHVVGHGVSGAVIHDVLAKQLKRVGKVDVLVIVIGSNDVTHVTKLDALERDTEQMLEQAQGQAGTVVLGSAGRLDTPNFPQPLRRIAMSRATQIRARQRRVAADQGVGFVNLGEDVADRFNRTPHSMSSDGFHPGAPGYGVWADAIAAEVATERPSEN